MTKSYFLRRSSFAVLLFLLISLAASASSSAGHVVERVSVASDGTEANAQSWSPSISADGRFVAFHSQATNLIPGSPPQGMRHVYVHDRMTGETRRVSVSSTGALGNNTSERPVISGDGSTVAFYSLASNLVPNDTNGTWDIFTHDLNTRETTRVSVSSTGEQANERSDWFQNTLGISADGRFVTFTSRATNLVEEELSSRPDVFVHDRHTGETTHVSVASDGTPGNWDSRSGGISADGRYVVFWSEASNLVPNDTNGRSDAFVHDRETGQTTRVSLTDARGQINHSSRTPSISADGSTVVFWSFGWNVVEGLPSLTHTWRVYAHHRPTGSTTLVSRRADGNPGSTSTVIPASLSADGRYVAFAYATPNLVEGVSSGLRHAYVRDLHSGVNMLASVNAAGEPGNSSSVIDPNVGNGLSISGDGQFVAFDSSASNLVPNDTNGVSDIFVYDRLAPTNVAPLIDSDGETVTVDEGQIATNSGTYWDEDDGDDVDISASIGTLTKTGTNSGTWTWEFQTTDGPEDSQEVIITADDGNGGVTVTTFDLVVENVNPTATLGNEGPVAEGSAVTISFSEQFDPSPIDTEAGFRYAYACDGSSLDEARYENGVEDESTTCVFDDGPSEHYVRARIIDKDDGFTEYTTTVDVLNVAPTATFNVPAGPLNEGDAFTISLTDAFDPSEADTEAGFSYVFDCGDGEGFSESSATAVATCTALDNPDQAVKGRIIDKDGDFTEYAVTIDVLNMPPEIVSITAPLNPVQVNTEITASAEFTDPGIADTHTALWDWGDGTTTVGTVTQGAGFGSVEDSHTYTVPGVYHVTLTVTDKDGGVDEAVYQYVVSYDPDGGFVTGNGSIESPTGAYIADPELAGTARFGFVSKYKKGANIPTGNTQFRFQAAGLHFRSDSYDWLVIAGARAQFKGTGTINGSGNYGFLLTAIDGSRPGGGGTDKFRIKIWDNDADGAIVYDNQLGESDGADPSTVINQGSIKIHQGK